MDGLVTGLVGWGFLFGGSVLGFLFGVSVWGFHGCRVGQGGWVAWHTSFDLWFGLPLPRSFPGSSAGILVGALRGTE